MLSSYLTIAPHKKRFTGAGLWLQFSHKVYTCCAQIKTLNEAVTSSASLRIASHYGPGASGRPPEAMDWNPQILRILRTLLTFPDSRLFYFLHMFFKFSIISYHFLSLSFSLSTILCFELRTISTYKAVPCNACNCKNSNTNQMYQVCINKVYQTELASLLFRSLPPLNEMGAASRSRSRSNSPRGLEVPPFIEATVYGDESRCDRRI